MLFLLLVAAALSVILLRPVCETSFTHTTPGQHSTACCESVADGSQPNLVNLASPGPGAKPLAASFAYQVKASFIAPLAGIFATAAPAPARSYYARTARILR